MNVEGKRGTVRQKRDGKIENDMRAACVCVGHVEN